MKTKHYLTAADVEILVDTAAQYATAHNFNVSIAVVDVLSMVQYAWHFLLQRFLLTVMRSGIVVREARRFKLSVVFLKRPAVLVSVLMRLLYVSPCAMVLSCAREEGF